MATEHILSLLIAERDKLNQAIAALKGNSVVTHHAPAAAAAPATAPAAKRRKRKPLSAAQRKAHSDRMRAFWAARRKKQGK